MAPSSRGDPEEESRAHTGLPEVPGPVSQARVAPLPPVPIQPRAHWGQSSLWVQPKSTLCASVLSRKLA